MELSCSKVREQEQAEWIAHRSDKKAYVGICTCMYLQGGLLQTVGEKCLIRISVPIRAK
jgi:hypothetical protein